MESGRKSGQSEAARAREEEAEALTLLSLSLERMESPPLSDDEFESRVSELANSFE
jgi:hypothetical protein